MILLIQILYKLLCPYRQKLYSRMNPNWPPRDSILQLSDPLKVQSQAKLRKCFSIAIWRIVLFAIVSATKKALYGTLIRIN